MKQSITQELDYGCGVACFAFICNMTFQQAVIFLGKEYSVKHGWCPSDLVAALNRYGLSYKNYYVPKKRKTIYSNGSIVLIERSSSYPVGHYLVFHDNQWMDPWINLPEDKILKNAKSGFRSELPGKAMYALIPT
ncbi:hypothetical protein M1145_00225 [Patescibacteria group bacterium]|nr:hypothetical protein [Patescibacteria group bacterium]